MSFFDEDRIYKEQYEKAYNFMKKGLTGDLRKDIDTLESTIQTLFDYQGIDWIGRGDIFLTKNQATIAATEVILYELKDKEGL